MKRSEKAEKIAVMLEEFYPETPVPLDHENPFQLLVAVLMSAQTHRFESQRSYSCAIC